MVHDPFSRFEDESPEERLMLEAEELMRQGRYHDAAGRYRDLRGVAPSDLWATLGYASALECAGDITEAEQVLTEVPSIHAVNRHLQHFRHLFFIRREDFRRAQMAREALTRPDYFDSDEDPPDRLGDLYFNQGRYHEARAEFERLLDDCSDGDVEFRSSLLARIGACQRQQGEIELARDHLQAALSHDSDNNWTLCELAEAERQLGDLDQARNHYEEALAREPEDHWCRGHLAQLFYEQGEVDRAIALYEHIIEAQPQALWAQVELAQVLTDDDPQRSAELCRAAIENDPSYPWAYAQLGSLAGRGGDHEEALSCYRQALAAAPGSTWIMHELADTCRRLGRFAEAYTHLEHARSINPFEASTYGFTADILRSENRIDEAMANLRKAVDLDSHYAWAWREMAELHGLAGRHDAADEAFAQVLELEHDDPANDGLQAFLLRCRGLREQALPFLERALSKQRDYLWAWREMIEHHLVAGRLDDAATTARAGLAALPDDPHLLGMLAEVLRRQGQTDDARQIIDNATTTHPQIPHLWAMRGDMHLARDPALALRYARRAVRLHPQVEYRLLLVQALSANGRHREARDEIDDLLTSKTPCAPNVYELATEMALRQGDPQRATDVLDAALRAHPHEPRLLIRAADLGLDRDDHRPLDQLVATCFEASGPQPWADIALLLARAGRALPARRAIFRLIDDAPDDGIAAAAWFVAAEIELRLGQRDLALQAGREALQRDPTHLPSRLLCARLVHASDPDGAGEMISGLIADIDHIIADSNDALVFQSALVLDDADRFDEAERCWQHLAEAGLPVSARIDAARHAAQHGHNSLSDDLLVARGGEDEQLLLRERCLIALRQGRSEEVRSWLNEAEEDLEPLNRLLLAQVLVATGHHDAVAAQLERIDDQQDAGIVRGRDQMQVRLLLITGDTQRARDRARALWRRAPEDLSSAVLLAQALVDEDPVEAHRLLCTQDWPIDEQDGEFVVTSACLHLDQAPVDDALHRLLRYRRQIGEMASHHPTAALLSMAWPTLAPTGAAVDAPVNPAALPPLPTMLRRLALALADHGHQALAARCLTTVPLHQRDQRRLTGLAINLLAAGGQRRAALALAWRRHHFLRLLRYLLPGTIRRPRS